MFVFQGVLRAGHGGGSGACASLYGSIAAKEEPKWRGGAFSCILRFRSTNALSILDDWAFRGGERGEMLDERIEHPNETVSFVLLNGEDNLRSVLRFLYPACSPLPFGLPFCNKYPAFTFILVTACGAKWAQDQEENL